MTVDDAPRPELFEGALDHAEAEALFRDLATCAEIQHVRTRGGQAADDAPPTLDDARTRLLSGAIKAVQIVYRFQDEGWCDTLMAGPDGVRLVRVRQEPGDSGA